MLTMVEWWSGALHGGPCSRALTWESASVERAAIAATLRNVSTTLDLGQMYEAGPGTLGAPFLALNLSISECIRGG